MTLLFRAGQRNTPVPPTQGGFCRPAVIGRRSGFLFILAEKCPPAAVDNSQHIMCLLGVVRGVKHATDTRVDGDFSKGLGDWLWCWFCYCIVEKNEHLSIV